MPAPSVDLPRHRFTVEDYHRMAEVGLLGEDDRVELLEGEVVEMTPIGPEHAGTVDRLNQRLIQALAGRAIVRVQSPIRLDDRSEPEPDLALLRPVEDFYTSRVPEPADVLAVIEVADTSYERERYVKQALYARAGIPELWIVDIRGTTPALERHVEPRRAEETYGRRETLAVDATIAPLSLPEVTLRVGDLLGA